MPKVLIVDDEAATVDMISTFLGLKGYEWAGAYDGKEAMVLLEVEGPDMMILDLMMPEMDGYEVCRRVRSHNGFGSTPILIVSARTDQEAIDRAMTLGANAYLTKPINLMELLSEIERLIS